MYHHKTLRVDHHQKFYHSNQYGHMRYIKQLESSRMYPKYDLLQDFVHCLIQCVKK